MKTNCTNKLLIIIVAILTLNTALTGLSIFHMRSTEKNETAKHLIPNQLLAEDLLEHSRRLAQDLGVQDRPPVKESLAGFNYAIDTAQNSDELAQTILNHGHRVQEIVLQERDILFHEKILALVNRDQNVLEKTEKTQFTLRILREKSVADPPILQDKTLQKIHNLYQKEGTPREHLLRLEIDEGKSRMLSPHNPLDYIQMLTEEIDSLRLSLHETQAAAGLSKMTGPGVTIHLYDAPDGYLTGEVVHDTDVRDIVNELLASGARGVTVGGQRLIATSPIRCVGPAIMVNQEKIPVNPVVIKAAGNPDTLFSGLDIIRPSLELRRGLLVQVEKKENVVLPPYRQ